METRRVRTRRRDLKHDAKMNPLSSFRLLSSLALCAALVGCASSADTTPAVVRTPPPVNYQKTVTDYLAVKIRNQPKNAEVTVGQPEPGACSLDAYTTSSRGWVVPVAYSTRTGEAGKDTIRINTKQYYFWFLGSTIAGITPRIELCPGLGASFEPPPPSEPAAVTTTAPPAPPSEADAAAQSKAATKPKSTPSAKAKKKPASTASNPKPN
jgi:cell division septation protein DedD